MKILKKLKKKFQFKISKYYVILITIFYRYRRYTEDFFLKSKIHIFLKTKSQNKTCD